MHLMHSLYPHTHAIFFYPSLPQHSSLPPPPPKHPPPPPKKHTPSPPPSHIYPPHASALLIAAMQEGSLGRSRTKLGPSTKAFHQHQARQATRTHAIPLLRHTRFLPHYSPSPPFSQHSSTTPPPTPPPLPCLPHMCQHQRCAGRQPGQLPSAPPPGPPPPAPLPTPTHTGPVLVSMQMYACLPLLTHIYPPSLSLFPPLPQRFSTPPPSGFPITHHSNPTCVSISDAREGSPGSSPICHPPPPLHPSIPPPTNTHEGGS